MYSDLDKCIGPNAAAVMFPSTSSAFLRIFARELSRDANISRHRLCCVSCGIAVGGQRRRYPGVDRRQQLLSSYSSESARTNADLIVRSPFQDLPLQRDVSLAGHLLDDFGRYGDLPAVVSVSVTGLYMINSGFVSRK